MVEDLSKVPAEELRNRLRVAFAEWTVKRSGSGSRSIFSYSDLVNIAGKLVTELKGRNVDFNEDVSGNVYSKEFYGFLVKKLGVDGILLSDPSRGLYLKEPHAKLIWKGLKSLIVKAKDFSSLIGEPLYLCGEKVYGVIVFSKMVPIDRKDFERLKRYHLVSDEERVEWWGETDKLYAYEFKFKKWNIPKEYEYPLGVQTIIHDVQIEKMFKPFCHPLGKKRQLKIFLANIPEHTVYIEPFAGAASLFWAKSPVPREVLNDVDSRYTDVFKFFKGGSDEEFEELRKFDWVPAEETFEKVKALKPKSNLERAYRTLYLSFNSYGGGMENFTHRERPHGARFLKYLEAYRERLKDTKVSTDDFEGVVEKYDSDSSFFYFDPPYMDEDIKGEPVEFKNRLYKVLKKVKGKWLLSFSDDSLVKDLFKSFNVLRFKTQRQLVSPYIVKRELLISNFPISIPWGWNRKARIRKEDGFNPEEVDEPAVRAMGDAELLRVDAKLHELAEEHGVKEPVLNAHIFVWREMSERGLEHKVNDVLTRETRFWIVEYPPKSFKEIISLSDVWNSFPDNIKLPKNVSAVYLCGGTVNRGYCFGDKDIDVRVACDEYDADVDKAILESIMDNRVRERVNFIWDVEGGIGNQILLYSSVNNELFGKDRTIQLFKPVQPMKSQADNEYVEFDELWKKYANKYIDRGIVVQAKYDGMSMMIHAERGGRTAVYTEDQLRDRSEAFRESVVELQKRLRVKSVILVAEMVEYKRDKPEEQIPREDLIKDGVDKWIAAKPAGLNDEFVVFNVHDCLFLNGEDVSGKGYEWRWSMIEEAVGKDLKHFYIIPFVKAENPRELAKLFNRARFAPNSEGAMFKVADSVYKTSVEHTGRSDEWAKIKNLKSIDTVVLDRDPVEGSPGVYTFECGIGPISEADKRKYPEKLIWNVKGKLYLRIGRAYNVKADLKQGDILEVRPIRLEWQREADKEFVTWMFPKVGIPRPEKKVPDTVETAKRLAALGTRPMKMVLKVSLPECPYWNDSVFCGLKRKVVVVDEDGVKKSRGQDELRVEVERLKYPVALCKLANFYKCFRIKDYYYGWEEVEVD